MRRPGDRLRSIAARMFGRTSAMERLIYPVIADLQHEYEEAIRRGDVWRSRSIRVAGYIAFWKVAGLAVLSADRRLGRAMAIALSTGTIITALLVWVTLAAVPPRIDYSGRTTWLVLYLIPQALTISVPVCLALGVFCRLRGRNATGAARRTVLALAIGCSLASFANLGWITPAANNAFRVFLVGRPEVRGANELTIGELRRRVHLALPGEIPEALPPAFWYHARLALVAAPPVLCLFAFATATIRRGRSGLMVLATLTFFVGCYAFFPPSQVAELARWLPVSAIAWIPNTVVGLATIAIAFTRPRATEATAG